MVLLVFVRNRRAVLTRPMMRTRSPGKSILDIVDLLSTFQSNPLQNVVDRMVAQINSKELAFP